MSGDPLLSSWDRLARDHSASPAVIDSGGGRVWSFEEIEIQARFWERELTTAGLNGLPVAFRQVNGGEWMVRFLTLLRLGAAALPIDPSVPSAGFRETAARCGAAIWEGGGTVVPPEHPRRFRAPTVALVKMTSGSTGIPRPLPFLARELAADGWQIMSRMGITAEDRNFALIPFGHSYGLGNLVMPLMLKGVPVVCGSTPLPRALAGEFAEAGATVFPGVPTLFEGLARTGQPLPGLRLAITAGAPLRPELARAFVEVAGRPLHNFLGSSETGGIAYDVDGDAGLSGRAVGRPIPGVRISTDPRGRLTVSGPAVFTRGNRRASEGFGKVTLGDVGGINADGELVLRGRFVPMIKVGARRLDPAVLERVLRELPGCVDAWVTGWPEGSTEQRPAAVIATSATGAEVRSALRSLLPGWMMPRPLVALKRLPVNDRGKRDRERLLELLRNAARE